MRIAEESREIKVKTVERCLMLLEILATQNSPLPLTRIGQLAKLSLSTTYRLLSTLCRSGFVERDKKTGHYKLGLKAFLIGNAALQNMDLRSVALPFLNQLAQQSAESVYLAILSGSNVIYSDCARSTSPLHIGIQTGIPISACQTSSGKVLIANLSLSERQQLAELYLQNKLIVNKDDFLARLEQIRLQQFSIEFSGFADLIREISVPVFYDHLKTCAGAISVFIPANGSYPSKNEETLLKELREAGREITKIISFPNV